VKAELAQLIAIQKTDTNIRTLQTEIESIPESAPRSKESSISALLKFVLSNRRKKQRFMSGREWKRKSSSRSSGLSALIET